MMFSPNQQYFSLSTFHHSVDPEKGKLVTVYPLFDMEHFKANVPKVDIKAKYKLETVFKEPIEERVQHVDLFKYRKVDPDFYRQVIGDTFSLYDEELISAHISKIFPLVDVNKAIEYIREKKCTGKVLIDIKRQPTKEKKDDDKEDD